MNDPKLLEALLASIARNALSPGSSATPTAGGNSSDTSLRAMQSAQTVNNTSSSSSTTNPTTSNAASNMGAGDLSSLLQGLTGRASGLLQSVQGAASSQGGGNLFLGLDTKTQAQLVQQILLQQQQGGTVSSAPTTVLPAGVNSITSALRNATQGLYSSQFPAAHPPVVSTRTAGASPSTAAKSGQPPSFPDTAALLMATALSNRDRGLAPPITNPMMPSSNTPALPLKPGDVVNQWISSGNQFKASPPSATAVTGIQPSTNHFSNREAHADTSRGYNEQKGTMSTTSNEVPSRLPRQQLRQQEDSSEAKIHSSTSAATGSVGSGREDRKRAANRISAQRCRKRKKEYIEELKEENDELRRLTLMLDVVPDLIISFDSSGILCYVSKSSTEFLDEPCEQLRGTSFWSLLDDASTKRIKSIFMDSLARREDQEYSTSIPLEDPDTACRTWELRLRSHGSNHPGFSLRGTLYFPDMEGGTPRCVCTIRHRGELKGDLSSSVEEGGAS